jgi:hypothetical protein
MWEFIAVRRAGVVAILLGVGDQTPVLSDAWFSSVAGLFLYVKGGSMGCSSAWILILATTGRCNSCKKDTIYVTIRGSFDMNFEFIENVWRQGKSNKGIELPYSKFPL